MVVGRGDEPRSVLMVARDWTAAWTVMCGVFHSGRKSNGYSLCCARAGKGEEKGGKGKKGGKWKGGRWDRNNRNAEGPTRSAAEAGLRGSPGINPIH